ncbi:MAG: MarR family transcriptional regulator [Spirochaetes bacterium]|nr:MarR family transcriptional regulator [Spirochaetota bacterium]
MEYKEDLKYLNLIFELSKKIFSLLYSKLEKLNLHPGQPPILLLLLKNNFLSLNEISKKIHVKASTVTVIIKKLEKNKLVKKISKEEDKRVLYVQLTEKGKEISLKTYDIIKNIEEEIINSFTEEERENLKYLFNKIILSLNNIKI